jgi:hypothetical protein
MLQESRHIGRSLILGLLIVGFAAVAGAAQPVEDTAKSAKSQPEDKSPTASPPRTGSAWLRVSGDNGLGPVSNEINDLAIGPSGALWVATSNGVSRLQPDGRFRHFTRAQGLPAEQAFALVSAHRGVFAATRDGLAWVDDLSPPDQMTFETVREGFVSSVYEHVGPQGPAYHFLVPGQSQAELGRVTLGPDGRPVRSAEPDVLFTFPERVRRVLPGAGDAVYYQVPPTTWYDRDPSGKSSPMTETPLDTLCMGSDLLVLTSHRLQRWKAGSKTSQDLFDRTALVEGDGCLAPSRHAGKVWVGRPGVLALVDLGSSSIERQLDLPSKQSLEGLDRDFEAFRRRNELRTWSDPSFVLPLPDPPAPAIAPTKDIPRAMVEAPDGRLWVATESAGLLMGFTEAEKGWRIVPEKTTPNGNGRRDGAGETPPAPAPPSAPSLTSKPPDEVLSPGPVDFTLEGDVAYSDGKHLYLFVGDGKAEPSIVDLGKTSSIVGIQRSGVVVTKSDVYLIRNRELKIIAKTPQVPLVSSLEELNKFEQMERGDSLLAYLNGFPEVTTTLERSIGRTELMNLEIADGLLTRLQALYGKDLSKLIGLSGFPLAVNEEGVLFRSGLSSMIVSSSTTGRAERVELPILSDSQSIVYAVADEKTGDILAIKTNRDLLRVDHRLMPREMPSPFEGFDGRFFSDFGSVVGIGNSGIWRRTDLTHFADRIVFVQAEVSTYGILPDRQGKGTLVYKKGKVDFSLFRINPDSTKTPITIDGQIQSGRDLVVRDRKEPNKVWISTSKGLFVLRDGRTEAERVKAYNLEYGPYSILPQPDGRAFLIGRGQGIYLLDKESLKEISKEIAFAPALFPTRRDGPLQLWLACANRGLVAIDLDTGVQSGDFIQLLQQVLVRGSGTPLAVKDLAVVGEELLVLTDHGLVSVRLGDGGPVAERIPIAWREEASQYRSLLVRRDGEVIAFTSEGGTTSFWRRRDPRGRFERIVSVMITCDMLAETPDRNVLVGCLGSVHELRGDEVIERLDLRGSRTVPEGRVRGLALLGPKDLLILANGLYRVHWESEPKSAQVKPIDGLIDPWSQHVRVNDSTLLLLHDDGKVSRIALKSDAKGGKGIVREAFAGASEKVRAMSILHRDDGSGPEVFLVDKKLIEVWEWGPAREALNKTRTIALPADLENGPIRLAADAGGLWLWTGANGLWRYSFSPSASREPWTYHDDKDPGLLSPRINVVVPRGGDKAVVFTQAGLASASRRDDRWSFVSENSVPGITSGDVRDGLIFALDGLRTVALATDRGVVVVCGNGGKPEDLGWSNFDRNSGLLDDEVQSLAWDGTRLWTGSRTGITVATLNVKDGRVQFLKRKTIRIPDGPGGATPVVAIRVDAEGKNAWILKGRGRNRNQGSPTSSIRTEGYELYRIDRERGQVFAAESFLLANAADAKLGPALAGKPPRILIRDASGVWSVWDFGGLLRPRLEVGSRFFGVFPQVGLEGIVGQEDEDRWEVSFALDRDDGDWSKGKWRPPIDFWSASPGHSLIVSVRPRGGGDLQYRAVAIIPNVEFAERLFRLVLFAIAIALLTSVGIAAMRTRWLRARQLRNRHVPYIVGEAIADSSRFFGREEVLKELSSSIATRSYALVGDFRTGKTSIQHQFTRRLKSVTDLKHIYLPVFIDLQRFSGGDDRFFHFLGGHLLQLAKADEVPADVLAGLRYGQVGPVAAYDVDSFGDDLKALLAHWNSRYAPRLPIVVYQIDEMGFLGNLTDSTRYGFRSIFVSNPQVKTVLSGKEVPGKDKDKISQWWNFFTELPMKPLTADESRRLIVEPVKGLFTFENETIEEIMIEAQREPYRIQRCART